MKKLIIAFAAVLVTAATSFAQGELNFSTRNTLAGVNGPVVFAADPTRGPGPLWNADLVLVGAGGVETPIASSLTTFQAPGPGAASVLERYVSPLVVSIPGSPAGSTVTLRMRAWETAAGSFANAALGKAGISAPFQVTLTAAPNPPADLPASFTGFQIPVPEPSTIALGVLGAAALLIRRRK